MSILHKKLAKAVPSLREAHSRLVKERGDRVVSDVNVRQVAGGMRGVNAILCDTSVVDPDKGLIIRGTPLAHLTDKLPEEIFFLLMTGDLPTADELAELRVDLNKRSTPPSWVWDVAEAMPQGSHPMTVLSAAVQSMDGESVFRKQYEGGMKREALWEAALEDSLRLIAVLPEIAAGIYRRCYDKGPRIEYDADLDWAGNLAHMLGNDDERFSAYMRVATIVQSDHEGGHASALTAHTVGSTLANAFLAVPAGWSALAGPLHGLASQVCLKWVLDAMEKYGEQPTDDEIKEYAWQTINAGRVIPGYGHAVLRAQDPRYLAILAYGEKNCPRAPAFRLVTRMSKIIPGVLMEQGKAKNPWPNVDAINGSVFYHYGITELPYYTVFFAVALTLGFTAQYVADRIWGTPITRPRSVTSEWIEKNTKRR